MDNKDLVILRSVIANRLDTIAGEMGAVLERSSRSPIFAEACDFSCGICDREGNLVSQLNGIPILAAAGTFSVKEVLKKYRDDISEGDVFIVNDPYAGGNHLPDIGIITPVFHRNRLIFFCVSRAHHGDIGGSAAGSYNPGATEIFQEGLRLPPLRIMTSGGPLREVMDLITYNTRNPEMLKSDLLAQVGACRVGMRRLQALVNAYGPGNVEQVVKDILNHGEKLARKCISQLPEGTYTGEEWVDDDGFQDHPIRIQANVTIEDDEILLDFAGTDAQVRGFVNSSLVTTTSAAYIACLWALSPEIPRNSGAFRAIKLDIPRGSLLNPNPPAPVTLCTLTCACELISAIFKAFARLVPELIPAGFGRYCGPSFFGIDPRNGNFYVGFAFCALGSGGGMKGLDGSPYMAPISNYGGVRAPNIESNEVQYPHITLRHEFEPDTAGAGQYRGGPGVRYEIQFYDNEPNIAMFGDGMKIPPYGLAGGSPGSLNRAALINPGEKQTALGSKEKPRQLQPGSVVKLVSSGGGGWGNPLDRKPEEVLEDYLNGITSAKKARDDYGVVITDNAVNEEMTAQLRAEKLNGKN